MTGLETYTSEELIRELTSRTTFVGIVIQSETEAKGITEHKKWNMSSGGNMSVKDTIMVIKTLAEKLRNATIPPGL